MAYNTNSFGNSLVANGNVKITKGTNFNSNTYIDPNTNGIDQTTSVLGIPFGTDFNTATLNRTLLSSTPQQLLHVRIVINQCNYPANIDFMDIAFTPTFSFYSLNANDAITNTLSYDITTYGSAITDQLCKPIVTYFTPTVATGIGDSIIIQGKYFGNNRFHNNGLDSAQVQFRNANINLANIPTSIMQRLDTLDYLYWSDTEIRVSATSLIKSEGYSGIGTGKFIVKNKWNDTIISNEPIRVKYAIKNYGQPYTDIYLKKRGNLIYDTTGYIFAFDSVILTDSVIKATTIKAIKDWACQTGVNFRFSFNSDSLAPNSYISFGTTANPNAIMITSSSKEVECYQNSITKYEIFITGFNITVNQNIPFDYDTTGSVLVNKRCYYSALLHELGHCHQLTHILNDQEELMRPTISTGQYKTFSPDLFLGTDDVIAYNQNHIYNGCNYSPMVFGNPYCSTNSILENEFSNSINIYPNPFTNQITIEFVANHSEKVDIIIYNIVGEIVYSSTDNSNQKVITVNLENFSKGSYIVMTKTDDQISTQKIIKIR